MQIVFQNTKNGQTATVNMPPEFPDGCENDTQRYLNGGHEVPISKVISRYYKSLLNATKAISFVDRAYVYDNSIDNQLPRLLYRTTDGQLFKQYVEDIPEWARMLLK